MTHMTTNPTKGCPRADRDAELLGAADRDPEAFARFYDRHVEAVLAFLYRRTADAEVAADLAAETFVQAFLSRRKFRRTEISARPWLFGIARRKLLRALRRGGQESRARRRLGFQSPSVDPESCVEIELLADAAALKEELREAIKELSPAVAQAVFLRVALDLAYDEVGARLGCSPGAARVRVMRGLLQLRDQLEVSPG
jgi:RNA polymerase sigma factor (sigma-70 family)